jgi:hypothetical protein
MAEQTEGKEGRSDAIARGQREHNKTERGEGRIGNGKGRGAVLFLSFHIQLAAGDGDVDDVKQGRCTFPFLLRPLTHCWERGSGGEGAAITHQASSKRLACRMAVRPAICGKIHRTTGREGKTRGASFRGKQRGAKCSLCPLFFFYAFRRKNVRPRGSFECPFLLPKSHGVPYGPLSSRKGVMGACCQLT